MIKLDPMHQKTPPIAKGTSQPVTAQSAQTMASAIFRHLTDEGCRPRDIIAVSSQLLSLVTTELQKSPSSTESTAP